MKESEKATETEMVSCKICLKEVPRSETETAEVGDYFVHFCGLDCYEKWHKKKADDKT